MENTELSFNCILIVAWFINLTREQWMVCKFYFNMLLYQITFIYIVLFTIQIVSKQLHSDNIKILNFPNHECF